jgi:peroxiredoxin
MNPLFKQAFASAALFALLIGMAAADEVVRPAPDFKLSGGKSLKSFKGQPVVLVIAPSPQSKAFRNEIRSLEKSYQAFAARETVFVAAFTQSATGVIESNIPFATASNGAAVAASYGATEPISVAVIGIDGNVDLATHKIAPAYKVRDAILNNFQLQASERPENMGTAR